MALATIAIAGCAQPDDEYQGPPRPKIVNFRGAVDGRYVGAWQTPDGRSTLKLQKDGSLGVVAVSTTPAGRAVSDFEGRWLVSDGKLLLRYAVPHQSTATLAYKATLTGNTLTLDHGGGRFKTIYKRK